MEKSQVESSIRRRTLVITSFARPLAFRQQCLGSIWPVCIQNQIFVRDFLKCLRNFFNVYLWKANLVFCCQLTSLFFLLLEMNWVTSTRHFKVLRLVGKARKLCIDYQPIRLLLQNIKMSANYFRFLAVVVAQLAERSLPISEVRDSNPAIGKNLFILNICLLSNVCWKGENKEKEAGDGAFKKILSVFRFHFEIGFSVNFCHIGPRNVARVCMCSFPD